MFEKQAVIDFFDKLAPDWDAGQILNAGNINTILDNAGVSASRSVLDVACGTGVLVPWYLEREVASVTAVDISPEMIRIGKSNHQYPQISFVLGDIEELSFDQQFDCVVVFNSFPHFPKPERLVSRLARLLKPGGSLTIAHSMSLEQINQHHSGSASKVSIGLLPANELAEIFCKFLEVTVSIDNDEMYQVVGVKRRLTNP